MELLLYSSRGVWQLRTHDRTESCTMAVPSTSARGQFDINDEYFDKNEVIMTHMTVAKYNSTLLAIVVGQDLNLIIQSKAVNNAHEDIIKCRKLMNDSRTFRIFFSEVVII